ncbi:MAG: hypothetical protein U0X74_03025 [Anaerolineales bacterium]
MAKVRKNPVIQGISGKIGNLVFKQLPDGSTIVTAKIVLHNKKWSEGQLAHQVRMKEAALYGKGAQYHPVYVALAETSTLTGYNWAFADRMKPPVIHAVERVEGGIRVRASDNVGVVRVEVQVLDEAGTVLTKGEAVQTSKEVWVYATAVAGRVVARAWDLAGNVGELVIGNW